MAGLIIFDPENELAGFTTGDDLAVGAYQHIESDTLYFTDAVSIYEWAGDADENQTYTWKSGQVRMPSPVNMGAAIVEAESYSETPVAAVAGDDFWDQTVFASNWTGTNGATTDTEDARSVAGTFNGTVSLATGFWALSPSSLNLDGITGYVTYGSVQADYDAYQMAYTDDFTIDGFFFLDNVMAFEEAQTFICHADAAGNINFRLNQSRPGSGSDLELNIGGTTYKVDIPAAIVSDWMYLVVQRRYNNGSPQIDFWYGQQSAFGGIAFVGTVTGATATPDTVTGPLYVGADPSSGAVAKHWDGKLDAFRVTKDIRFPTIPANIDPPTVWYTSASVAAVTYDVTFKLYADGTLKHTQTVTDSEPFRLPGGYLSNLYEVEIISQLPVTRVSVAESIFELAEG